MEGISRREFITGGAGLGAFVLVGGVGGLSSLGLMATDVGAAVADPTEMKVRLWARAGTTSAYATPTGATWLGVADLAGSYPSGTSIGFLGVASTGQLITGVATQSGDDNFTAHGQKAAVLTRTGSTVAMQLVAIPTDKNVLEPPHSFVQPFVGAWPDGYGAADTSDVVVFTDANGEHAVLNSLRPYNGGWRIGPYPDPTTGSGTFPVLPVITRAADGSWVADTDYSTTTKELHDNPASSVGSVETFFPPRDVPGFFAPGSDGKWYAGLDVAELDRFPNGDILVSQYFSSDAAHAAGVVVVRLAKTAAAQPVAGYVFPNFFDVHAAPGAAAIPWSCRNVTVDPSFTSPTDYRFFVSQDAFAAAAFKITGASRTGNVVTVVTDAPHGFGVGQFPIITGLPGTLAVFNLPAGTTALEPIYSVPSATSFTMIQEGADVASAPTGDNAVVKLRFSAATVEMRYDAVHGTIEPVSFPFHLDEHHIAIGTTAIDEEGTVFLTPGGTVPFTTGALSLIRKSSRLPEGAPVAFDATTFAKSWGTVRHPDAAFASTAGPGSFAGTVALDLDFRTAYWAVNDYVHRVQVESVFQPVPVQRVADPWFANAPRYNGFFTTVASVVPPIAPDGGAKAMKVTSQLNQPVTAPKANSTEVFAVEPGQMYLVTAQFLAGAGMSGQAAIGVQFKNNVLNTTTNSYGSVGGVNYGPLVSISDGAWTYAVLIVAAPPGAAGAVVTTKVEGMGPYGQYFVSRVMFEDRNRMANPGFEWPLDATSSDSSTRYDAFVSDLGTNAIDLTGGRSMPRALRITPNAGAVSTTASPAMPAVPGQSYIAKGWVKPVTGEARVAFGVRFAVSSGPAPLPVYGPPQRLTGSTYAELVAYAVAPPNTTSAQLVIRVDRAGTAGSVAVDDLSFEEAPGTSLPDVNLHVSSLRTGGPTTDNYGALSSGRPVIDRAHRKLFVPVFQLGAQDGLRFPTFGGQPSTPAHISSANASLSYDQQPNHAATPVTKRVLKVVATAGITAPVCTWNDRFDAAPGVDYSVRGWFKATVGGGTLPVAAVGVRWTCSDGTVSDGFGTGVNVAGSGWTQIDQVVPSPDKAVSGVFIVRVTMPSAAQTFWLDDVSLLLAHGGTPPPVALDQYVFEIDLP